MMAVMEAEPRPTLVDSEPRCWRCGRMLAWLAARPWRISCGKCKALNASPPNGEALQGGRIETR